MTPPSKTRARRTPTLPLGLQGSMWVAVGDAPLGGHGRMALLRAVGEHGSLTKAARAFGISYKGAWDAIEAMHAVCGEPLVERVTGGRGGGSTRLTAHGRRLVERHALLDAVHRRFVAQLAAGSMDLSQEFSLLEVLNMQTSARNQWVGRVVAVVPGAVNDEVQVQLDGGARLVATVTRASSQGLGLSEGRTVVALVKAPSVLVATDLGAARVSAGNRFDGVVRALTPGAVQAEVTIEADGGLQIVAIVTLASAQALGLREGSAASALIQASGVILATVD